MKRHDHRRSIWILAGRIGTDSGLMWCYQCGSWRWLDKRGDRNWHKPTGIGGPNPAVKAYIHEARLKARRADSSTESPK